MKLTNGQKEFFSKRTIKIGQAYMFPRFGFFIYAKPCYSSGEFFGTNPFTKSLDHERFLVKDKIDGFYRGNFEHNPKGADVYLEASEFERIDAFEKLILYVFCYIPLIIYNFFAENKKAKL